MLFIHFPDLLLNIWQECGICKKLSSVLFLIIIYSLTFAVPKTGIN